MKKEEVWQKNFLIIGILALLIFLSYKIIKPYIITLLTTFVLAYMIHPLHRFLKKRINQNVSAIICILVLILVIFIPSFFIGGELANQTTSVLNNSEFTGFLNNKIDPFMQSTLNITLSEFTTQAGDYVLGLLKEVALKLPAIIISFILMIFGIFYLLIYWEDFGKHIKKFMPVNKKDKLAHELKQKSNAIIFGSILIAIIEGIIAFVGFSFVGVKISLLLAILIFFLAFIPGIGSSVVWIPLTIYYFLSGDTPSAFAILGIGIIMGYGVDTFLRARILGKNTQINPFILLLGILGGVTIFGVFGFIIGPLLLVYTIKIVEHFLDK